MAKNRFDQDERLERGFDLSHLKRAFVYIKRHRARMAMALMISAIASVCSLVPAKLIGYAVDYTIPSGNIRQLLQLGLVMVAMIGVSVTLAVVRSRIMVKTGQYIIYDIRNDLFDKLQQLPFQYYDDRPHGKILVRLINYMNNVSDMLSNGIVNFVLEVFNIIFILIFMFTTNVTLTLIVLVGIPLLLVGLIYLEPKQRKAWQNVNNKGSNMNAFLQESINGVKISQSFVRHEENERIFEDLNRNNYGACMKAIKLAYMTSPVVDVVSVSAVALMTLAGVAWVQPAVTFGILLVMGDYAWRMWQPIILFQCFSLFEFM